MPAKIGIRADKVKRPLLPRLPASLCPWASTSLGDESRLEDEAASLWSQNGVRERMAAVSVAFVEIVELAADRHAMGEARHLDVEPLEAIGDVMGGGLAVDGGVDGQG